MGQCPFLPSFNRPIDRSIVPSIQFFQIPNNAKTIKIKISVLFCKSAKNKSV
ncbi:MAG: hypothetical protein ACTSVV_02605 [Promethearchaeota archaeon]